RRDRLWRRAVRGARPGSGRGVRYRRRRHPAAVVERAEAWRPARDGRRVRGGCAGPTHPRSVLHRPAAASRVGGNRSTNRRPSGSPGCRRGAPTDGRDSSVPNETPPRQSRAAGGWRWVIPGAANPSLPISIGDSQMKTIVAMSRTCLLLTILTALGVGGAILAQHVQHTGKGQVKVTQLFHRDLIEKLDGKAARATVVEETFEPRQKDSPHRPHGPV